MKSSADQIVLGFSRTTLDDRIDRGLRKCFEIAGDLRPIAGVARRHAGFEEERQRGVQAPGIQASGDF